MKSNLEFLGGCTKLFYNVTKNHQEINEVCFDDLMNEIEWHDMYNHST